MSSTYKIVQTDEEFEEVWDFLKSVTKGPAKELSTECINVTYSPNVNYNVLIKQEGEEISMYQVVVDSIDGLKEELERAGLTEDNTLTTTVK